MPEFDRYDICAAYSLIESHYHVGGWVRQRKSNQRRMESTGVQLHRMGYADQGHAGLFMGDFDDLSENAQEIYKELEYRYGFITDNAQEVHHDRQTRRRAPGPHR